MQEPESVSHAFTQFVGSDLLGISALCRGFEQTTGDTCPPPLENMKRTSLLGLEWPLVAQNSSTRCKETFRTFSCIDFLPHFQVETRAFVFPPIAIGIRMLASAADQSVLSQEQHH